MQYQKQHRIHTDKHKWIHSE